MDLTRTDVIAEGTKVRLVYNGALAQFGAQCGKRQWRRGRFAKLMAAKRG